MAASHTLVQVITDNMSPRGGYSFIRRNETYLLDVTLGNQHPLPYPTAINMSCLLSCIMVGSLDTYVNTGKPENYFVEDAVKM